MRRLPFALLAAAFVAACDAPPASYPAVSAAPQETVFVRDRSGDQLLLLCAAGVICNASTGHVIHHYPRTYVAPPAYTRYVPSSPRFYTRAPEYRVRYAAPAVRPPSSSGLRPRTSSGYQSATPRPSVTRSWGSSSSSAPRSGYRSPSSSGFRSPSSSGFRSSSSSGSRSSSRRF